MTNHAPPALGTDGFRKSSFSTDTADPQCVYVAQRTARPAVEFRDSKRGLDTPGLTVGSAAFRAFIAAVSASG
jgi:hypothetical protein